MKVFRLALAFVLLLLSALALRPDTVRIPRPSADQMALQDMEMYAFLHYSLNTYTDKEWGLGNEDPALFNPANLDARQWARTCKEAGMKGIILTAKHHGGFCLWPSEYTDYSVRSAPWRDGKGDVVRELADACRKEGLKFAVYLSPWDRNHPDYGKPEYVDYFRNQLRELLTNYGPIFEVWFDGANGGSGWYGGADETRKIDPLTYYGWRETYDSIRAWQPHCMIWNDGADLRGDLRWVGTEAGYVGDPNWSFMRSDSMPSRADLQHGVEDGDVWVGAETNTSIRPGWFYHTSQDGRVKSLAKLMDTYYKSVGRNSTLLLNFPITPDGRIHTVDSARGAAFGRMVRTIFSDNLATDGSLSRDGQTFMLSLPSPRRFNRFVASEDISAGQRVRSFTLEALTPEGWTRLHDELSDTTALTTIGRKRIVCFPPVEASAVRLTVLDAKADPIITQMGLYLAPEITPDTPDSGLLYSADYKVSVSDPGAEEKSIVIDLPEPTDVREFHYLPPQQADAPGVITRFRLFAERDGSWHEIAAGEFSIIVNNPVWQTVELASPVRTSRIRLEAASTTAGAAPAYADFRIR